MKILEKNKAIDLRKQGKTFSEILKEVSVSKGSLSYWLRDINLTDGQLTRIRYKNDKIKKKFIRLKVQAYGKDKIPPYEKFWSHLTGIPLSQFIKPYVKISKYSKLRRGNTLPYGTLQVRISDIGLQSKISGWIKALEALSSSPV